MIGSIILHWLQESLLLARLRGTLACAQSTRTVRIGNQDFVNAGEVSIAINLKNPDNIIAVSQQFGRKNGGYGDNRDYAALDDGRF